MVTLKRVTGATGAVPDGSGLSSGRWRLETAGTGIFRLMGQEWSLMVIIE